MMTRYLKIFAAFTILAALCTSFTLFASADSETFSLDDVTDDMLTDIDGVPTFVIESDNNVYITGGKERVDSSKNQVKQSTYDFAVSVKALQTTIQVSGDFMPLLALNITGDLIITGGDIQLRNDGTALTLTDSTAKFTNCTVIAKSLASTGAALKNSTITFGTGGRLAISGAVTGVEANASAINVVNGGVFKAYSVHSAAVRLLDKSTFDIAEGKVFLGGSLFAVSGSVSFPEGSYVSGDLNRQPSAIVITPGQKINITIDPGHGGKDPGAVYAAEQYSQGSANYNFYLEKNLTLLTAKYLKQSLEESDMFNVTMTRDNDTYLSLSNRCSIAYENDADLLISVHFNYDPAKKLTGASAYVSQFSRYRLDGLADLVLDNLSALGMNALGELVRLDTANDGDAPAWWDIYDNVRTDEIDTGIFADYYGIVNGPTRTFTFPLLIEHLHLSSKDDMEIIKNEAGVASLGKADAEAVKSFFRCGDNLSEDTLQGALIELYENAHSENSAYLTQDIASCIEQYMKEAENLYISGEHFDLAKKLFFK